MADNGDDDEDDLGALRRDRDNDGERDRALREIMGANGIREDEMRKPETVTHIEMVLDESCSMKGMRYFPNLRSIILINQAVTKIEGLETCVTLEKLMLNENMIEKVEGFSGCCKLKTLHLCANLIRELGNGLNGLVELQVLWIAENKLTNLSGLHLVPTLTELNASRNHITSIVRAFERNTKLVTVNLSDNRMCSFRDVMELTRLQQLTELDFSDPDWGENPLCMLCNYQTYILYHLPNLTVLDRMRVSKEEHQHAEAAFARKRLYYNMRAKVLRRHAADAMRAARALHEDRSAEIRTELEKVSRSLKRIDGFAEAKAHNPPESLSNEGKPTESDVGQLKERLAECQAEIADQVTILENLGTAINDERESCLKSFHAELMSGGNIRFEQCAPDKEAWSQQVEDLVRARFRSSDYGSFGIADIKVTSITKIANQSLRARFEDELERLAADGGTRSVEYLFYVPDVRCNSATLRTMAMDGPPRVEGGLEPFPSADDGDGDMTPNATEALEDHDKTLTLLTNSVSLAERGRLEHLRQSRFGEALARSVRRGWSRYKASLGAGAYAGVEPGGVSGGSTSMSSRAPVVCGGSLLVCSAYLGDPRPDEPATFDGVGDADFAALWRRQPSRLRQQFRPAFGRDAPADDDGDGDGDGEGDGGLGGGRKARGNEVPRGPNFGIDALYRAKSGDNKQKIWRMPNPEMVLPEFIVEFEYVYSSDFVRSRIAELQPSAYGDFAVMFRDFAFAAKVAAAPVPEKQQGAAAEAAAAAAVCAGAPDVGAAVGAIAAADAKEAGDTGAAGAGDAAAAAADPTAPPSVELLDDDSYLDPELKILGPIQPTALGNIKVLNLHGRGIRRFSPTAFEPMSGLQVLLLSFNSIASFTSFPECKTLERLDVSFNLVEKVSSLSFAPALSHLDISWNFLGLSLEIRDIDASLNDVFVSLARDVPDLKALDMRGNLVTKSSWYRTVALSHLRKLRSFDGQDVRDGEVDEARERARRFEGVELTEALLLAKSYLFVGCSPSSPSASPGSPSRSRLPPLDLGDAPEQLGPLASTALALAGPAGGVSTSGSGRVPGLTRQTWRGYAEVVDLRDTGLSALIGFGMPNLSGFKMLRRLILDGNKLTSLDALAVLANLEELSVENNSLPSLAGLGNLQQLQRLAAGTNRISDVLELRQLQRLMQLSLEDNLVDSLDTFAHLSGLMELYLSNNLVEEVRSILLLKQLPRLLVLDLSANELCASPDFRLYTIFHLRRLKVLDGISILPEEQREAEERFSGKITMELLEDKLGPAPSCYSFRSVDLSSHGLRELGTLLNDDIFPSLRELNLDGNAIADIRSLGPLSKLLVLKMNRTKIDLERGVLAADDHTGISSLPHLQVLELGFCGIADMAPIASFPLQTLRILHLPGNEITRVDGLSHMEQLRELVLDKNKIKSVDEHSFDGLRSLRELRMDDNGLKSLANFGPLPRLRALHLSLNRVAELSELEKLRGLRHVVVVNLAQNPVARKPLYRAHLIHAVSSVRAIDSREVTDEERERVDQLVQGGAGQAPPGAGIYVFTETIPQAGMGGGAQPPPPAPGVAGPPSQQSLACVMPALMGGHGGGQDGGHRRGAGADAGARGGGGGGGGGPTQSHLLMTGLGFEDAPSSDFGRGPAQPRRSSASGAQQQQQQPAPNGAEAPAPNGQMRRRQSSSTGRQVPLEYRSPVMPPGSGR